jgi:putative peptidoglycan lipid II flippase
VYGLAPILYNLGIISGILFLAPSFGITGVVLGVLLGAALYLLIQIPTALNCGFKYRPILRFKEASVKEFFLLALPRIFGISVQQINTIFITAIASTLISGSLVVFTFSYNFSNFITGILGTSFAVAAFPGLSKSLAELKNKEFIDNFSSTFRKIIYLVVPASVFVFLLKNQIITFWLRHGLFSSIDANLIAASLGLLSLGLFASCLIPLIFRGFFAFKDTKTPTLISIFSVLSNIVMCLFFTNVLYYENYLSLFFRIIFHLQGINDIRVLGLSLALFVSTVVQFILMIVFFKRRITEKSIKI